MTYTILNIADDTTMTPELVLGYDWSAPSRNIVHPLLGGVAVAVTLRRAGLRRGTMRMLFLTEDGAMSAFYQHRQPTRFYFEDSERESVSINYVVDGDVRCELDPITRERWVVSVDYQGVDPTWVPA